eukprot:scaffold2628_cov113-Isochrysis_galbana.AAC.13
MFSPTQNERRTPRANTFSIAYMLRLEDAIGLTREARVLLDAKSLRIVHASSAVYTLNGKRFTELADKHLSELLCLCPDRLAEVQEKVSSCARFTDRVKLSAQGEPPFDAIITAKPVGARSEEPPTHVSIRIVRLVPSNMPMPTQLLDEEGRKILRAIVACVSPEDAVWQPLTLPNCFKHDDGSGSTSDTEPF